MRSSIASGSGFEGVAHPADGTDAGGFAATVELLAQVRDVEVHHVGVDLGGTAPHGVEEDRAGEDLSRALYQGSQQCELLGRQLDALAPAPDLVADRI